MNYLMLSKWSPYIVGILIGLLNIGALLISKKPLGASTSFMKFGGILYKSFSKNKVVNNKYYKKNSLKLDWGIMLVIGIIIGSFLSAFLSNDFTLNLIPKMWKENISSSGPLRVFASLVGGVFLGVGARWANGCTSGHGISGNSMLSVISFVASIAFFIGGILTAFLIYGF